MAEWVPRPAGNHDAQYLSNVGIKRCVRPRAVKITLGGRNRGRRMGASRNSLLDGGSGVVVALTNPIGQPFSASGATVR